LYVAPGAPLAARVGAKAAVLNHCWGVCGALLLGSPIRSGRSTVPPELLKLPERVAVSGLPVCHWNKLESCHPPTICAKMPLDMNGFPAPNGSSYTGLHTAR